MARNHDLDQHRITRRTALASALAVLALGSPAGVRTSGVAAQEDAAALLTAAAQKMATVKSFSFELSTVSGQSTILQNLELVGAEGSVLRPQSFEATITAKVAIIEVKVKVVGIGNRLWVTDPTSSEERFIEVTGNGDGEGAGTENLADLINPDRLLLAAVGYVTDPRIDGTEKLDGIQTTRVVGTFDAAALAKLAPASPEAGSGIDLLTLGEMPITIWIDDQGYVLRIELDGPLTVNESPNVVRRLDIFDIDEPVEIPEPANVVTPDAGSLG